MNNGIGRVWAVNAEGGDEGRPNGVGPVIIENIDKLGGGLPDPSGASEGDVLTVGDNGPEWAAVPTPTVDQNYSASSANAQSGVAVAQAIAAIPSSSYTAGDGIDITAGEVSVKAGNGLSIGNATTPPTQLGTSTIRVKSPSSADPTTTYSISDICTLTPDLLSKIAGEGLTLTLSLPFTFTETATLYAGIVSFLSETSGGVSIVNRLVLGQALAEPASVIPEGSTITFNGADAHTSFSNVTLQDIQADTTSIYHLAILNRYQIPGMSSYFYGIGHYSFGTTQPTTPVTTATYGGSTITDALNVDLPVPSTTGHSQGEVLTLGASGIEWTAVPEELPDSTGASQGDVLSIGSSGLEWATPSAGGSPLVVKDIDMSSASTTSGSNKTTITVPLSSADQFYALGKQIAVCYTTSNTATDVTGATIRLYYTVDNQFDLYIPMPANNYATSQCYWAGGLIVGFESYASNAPDPSQGWPFTKIEIVVEGIMWAPAQSESIKVHLLG